MGMYTKNVFYFLKAMLTMHEDTKTYRLSLFKIPFR